MAKEVRLPRLSVEMDYAVHQRLMAVFPYGMVSHLVRELLLTLLTLKDTDEEVFKDVFHTFINSSPMDKAQAIKRMSAALAARGIKVSY